MQGLQSLGGKSLERSYAPLVSQTRVNISTICNRIFMVPCKLDRQEKKLSGPMPKQGLSHG